jgi:TolA-binding protein
MKNLLVVLALLIVSDVAYARISPERIREYRERAQNRDKDRQERDRTEQDRERQIEQARKDIEKRAQQRRKIIEKLTLNMIKALYKKAQEAEKAENWGAAYSHYHDVSMSKLRASLDIVSKSKVKLDEIGGKVDGLMRQARMHELRNEYVDAAKVYMQIIKDFEYHPQKEDARRRLRVLERSPRSAAAIKYAAALALEKSGEVDKAKAAYEKLIDRYPESLDALRSKRQLKELEAGRLLSAPRK